MRLVELCQEIFSVYPKMYAADNKLSNPYVAQLKKKIKEALQPLASEYALELDGPGGQGLMRKSPYIVMARRPNVVNKGIYPHLHFDLAAVELILGLGDADDNPPPEELAREFAEKACSLLPDFKLRKKDGYPYKALKPDALQNESLEIDLRKVLQAYAACLDEFAEDLEEYLSDASDITLNEPAPFGKGFVPTEQQIDKLIDEFLRWYQTSDHGAREKIASYQKFNAQYFRALSESDLVKVVFEFAREGGHIQSGGHRTAGRFKESVAKNPSGFRQLALDCFDKGLDLDRWWSAADDFVGFGKGIRTIFLHRVRPDEFCVYNNKSESAFKLLGLMESPGPGQAGAYLALLGAAKKLVSYRPDSLNLFKADAMTHYLMGTEEGKEALARIADIPAPGQSPSHFPLNTILYGPPGTGKTYLSINAALEIISGDPDYCRSRPREAIVKEFNRLKEEGQVEFITFHQSYSYEEFIEGIRPVLNADKISYEIRAGILKRMADRASIEFTSSATQYSFDPAKINFYKMSLGDTMKPEEDDIYSDCIRNGYISLGWGGNVDYSRVPTTSDWSASKKAIAPLYEQAKDGTKSPYGITAVYFFKNLIRPNDLVLVSLGNFKIRAIGRVKGEYSYNLDPALPHHHFRKVEWLTKDVEIPAESLSKKQLSQQTIYQFDKNNLHLDAIQRLLGSRQLREQPKRYVLIIDEINRGNISRIFGELISLIEEDKRLGAPNELRVRLPYSGDDFGLPGNLYFVGTMNTADRSIALIDVALRRRFAFKPMDPDLILVSHPVLRRALAVLNQNIIAELGPDFTIGHSYFIGKTEADLPDIMNSKILPLMSEYFYNDNDKILQMFQGSGIENRLLSPTQGGKEQTRSRLVYAVDL